MSGVFAIVELHATEAGELGVKFSRVQYKRVVLPLYFISTVAIPATDGA